MRPRCISSRCISPLRNPSPSSWLSRREESLSVREPANPTDPDSANPELGPAFVAYSASGAVTAPVVYVNYGLPPDYDQLAAAGIDVKGKIVIARYARSHRAVKIHTAEQHGAAAIIIYSDPADDGYAKGLVWPEGPWRADFMMQRGNGKYSWFWHGDPLSPGVAARSGAAVLEPATAPTLPRIPAVVLSYKEASKILAQLRGPAVPAGFQGALPFTYRLGPGPAVVKLDVRMDAGWRTIRDMSAGCAARIRSAGWCSARITMPGLSAAWTQAAAHRRSSKQRVRWVRCTSKGWVPDRSIVFAFWDAEEFGLVGSTEYAEAFEKQLREKAVAYINTDLFMRGQFGGGGTPSLRDFLVQVAKDVPGLTGKTSVYDDWRPANGRSSLAERRRRGSDRISKWSWRRSEAARISWPSRIIWAFPRSPCSSISTAATGLTIPITTPATSWSTSAIRDFRWRVL